MLRKRLISFVYLLLIVSLGHTQDADFTKVSQAFRQGKPVPAVNDTTVIAEAEEFKILSPGWQAKPFGTNYYAATFANSFLSRKAYLGAPEECETTLASIEVQVPKAGKYLALVRYEAAYRFETQFTLTVEQKGAKKLERLYGARDNLRIWAFREKLKKEVAWSWGAVENVVWEGHDALVDLDAGTATLTLKASKQPGLAARRNIDLVMLTSDLDQVKMRIEKENFLPLDGMLTQAGDVYLKVHNHKDGGDLKLTVPNCTEHSPYWVHLRNWKPINLAAKPGETSDWIEVGVLLDTLSDGQWAIQTAGKGAYHFDLEFGLKDAAGKIASIRRFANLREGITLAFDADTRYSRRIRSQDDVLYDLVSYLKKHPVKGTPPKQTLIFGYTFPPKPADAKYTAALDEFVKLIGATALAKNQVEDQDAGGIARGYIDVRSIPTAKLEEYCKKLQTEKKADRIAVVSLGDEIGLPEPSAKDHAAFRVFLKSRGLKPEQVDPASKGDWEKIAYNPKLDKDRPELFYYSKIWAYRFGIQSLKERTDILKKYLPNAGIGANFSPHHGHLYLGDTHHWISVFRDGGMTLPWGEDYIWQVPVGSQQMNFLMLDMFRCAIKTKPGAKIHYYVMPHTPGNTPNSWRRQFYGDLAHGAKQLNLFEFRPVQAAYTENHTSDPAIYQEIRKSFHELAAFEDIIQEGTLPLADTAIWCSETADVWDNHKSPFDAAKRTLYVMLRQMQRPVDFVLDGDELKPYQTLVLCDANVSRAGSKAIVAFVKNGGNLLATAGAGMFDEFNRPNEILRTLLGVAETNLEVDADPVKMEKQDLPFAKPLDELTISEGGVKVPIFGARDRAKLAKDAKSVGMGLSYREEGKGKAWYCTFLPGLSYFHPALPKRPVDRGSTDDSMAHFIPTKFLFPLTKKLNTLLPAGKGVVQVQPALVDHTWIQSKKGAVIPISAWQPGTLKDVRVTVPNSLKAPTGSITLASGRPVRLEKTADATIAVFDLDVADALIFRAK